MSDHLIVVDAAKAEVALGREFSEFEQQALHDAIAIELHRLEALAGTLPHAVHVEPEYETLTIKTYDPARVDGAPADTDEQAPYWEFPETRQTNRPLVCPDSGHELQAGNDPTVGFDFLVCPLVPAGPLATEDRPCHAGCVVACGLTE